MRFLDIAVAAVIGLLSTSLIGVSSPAGNDFTAYKEHKQAALRDRVEGLLNSGGLVWLQDARPEDICARLESLSNSSVAFSAVVSAVPCSLPPIRAVASANLSVILPSRTVVLEAWALA